MRKTLLMLSALLLSVSASEAQGLKTAPFQKTASAVNVQQRAIAANQKYLFVPGADSPVSGWGMPQNAGKVTRMGCVIPASYMDSYVGARIVGMRFLTQSSLEVVPRLYENGGATQVALAPSLVTAASTLNEEHTAFDEHWNEVTFAKPYTIPASPKALMVAFDYAQASTKDAAGYPFLIGKTTDSDVIIRGYGDFGEGEQWKDVRTGNAMCVQLLVEKDDAFIDDLSMVSIIANPMVKIEPMQLFPFQFIVRNTYDGECSDAQFSIMLDGKEIGYTETVSGYGIGKAGVIYSTGFYPSRYNLKDGVHTIGMKVKTVNGVAPAGDTSDDIIQTDFRVYTESTERQSNLIEFFTSNTDAYSAIGTDALRTLQTYRDDVAWTAIHVNSDPLAVDAAKYIYQYSATGCPAFNVNRLMPDNSRQLAYMLDTNNAADYAATLNAELNQQTEQVASLVKLGLSTNLTLADNPQVEPSHLVVKVGGYGVENAAQILDTAVLGLYITDSDNVLRLVATDNAWGDAIVWNGDNFERTYELSLPAGICDYEAGNKLNVVAFVSLPFAEKQGDNIVANANVQNVWVDQCLAMPIEKGFSATSVGGISADSNVVIVARYATDGTRLATPVKGINILKMSDGTTRKVVVK